jgi:hypothetical protein
MKAEKRKEPPLHVKLEAALRQLVEAWKALGRVPADETPKLEFDHHPALGLREVCQETGQHIPHQHSAEHLRWMPKEDHDRKTRGTGATTNGTDIGEMRKTRQLVKKRKARESPPEEQPPERRTKPKAKIAGRGFDRPKKIQARATGYKRRGV